MDQVPGWLGAVATLIVIASALGAAVAVFKTSAQGASLKESERTVERLRGEIGDYVRRETELNGEIRVMEANYRACGDRLRVVEDLLTGRVEDEEIRAEIAAVRRVVDENVLTQLTAILNAINRVEGTDDHQ